MAADIGFLAGALVRDAKVAALPPRIGTLI
jgi:hypothetical protein